MRRIQIEIHLTKTQSGRGWVLINPNNKKTISTNLTLKAYSVKLKNRYIFF